MDNSNPNTSNSNTSKPHRRDVLAGLLGGGAVLAAGAASAQATSGATPPSSQFNPPTYDPDGTVSATNRLPPAPHEVVTPADIDAVHIKEWGIVLPSTPQEGGHVEMSLRTEAGSFHALLEMDRYNDDVKITLLGRNALDGKETARRLFSFSPIQQRDPYQAYATISQGDIAEKDLNVPPAADNKDGRALYKKVFMAFYNKSQESLPGIGEMPGISTVHDICGYSKTGFMVDNGEVKGYAVGQVVNEYPARLEDYNLMVPSKDPGPFTVARDLRWVNADVTVTGWYNVRDPQTHELNPDKVYFRAQLERSTTSSPILKSVQEYTMKSGQLVVGPNQPLFGPHAPDPEKKGMYERLLGQMTETSYARDVDAKNIAEMKLAQGLCTRDPNFNPYGSHTHNQVWTGPGHSPGTPGIMGTIAGFKPTKPNSTPSP